jgi:predicted RNA methylase
MLELASLREGEKLVDLGAGDGRIVIAAAREYGLEAVGIEIDPVRWMLANSFILWFRPYPRPRVVWGDMYQFDLSGAHVVTIYLTRTANDRLREKFEREMQAGSRVVSYSFPISGWTPILIDDRNLIFVYQVGKTDEDTPYVFV